MKDGEMESAVESREPHPESQVQEVGMGQRRAAPGASRGDGRHDVPQGQAEITALEFRCRSVAAPERAIRRSEVRALLARLLVRHVQSRNAAAKRGIGGKQNDAA